MFSTTNPPHNNDDPARIAELLRGFAAGQRSAALVTELSDLSRPAALRVSAVWPTLPVETRRYLARQMVDLAESNLKLSFTRALRAALRDPDPDVRALAIAGLWEDESSTFLDLLIESIQTETEPIVLEAIVVALGRFNYLIGTGVLDSGREEQVRAALLDCVDSDAPVSVRRRALESVSYLSGDEEVDTCIDEAYHSRDHAMRVSAVFAMGRNLGDRWLPTVIDELGSDDSEMRYEAAKASGEFGDQRAVDPLLSLVEDEDAEVMQAAVAALGQIGGKMAVNVLRRLTRAHEDALREAAQDALAQAMYASDPLRPDLS